MPATRKTSSDTTKETRVSSPIQKRKNRVIDKHLKEIIIEKFFDDDLSKAQVAKLFKLNWSTVDGIIERYVERGTLENLPRGGRKEKLVKLRGEHSELLNEILDEDCQLTLGIMKNMLLERFPDLVEKGISIPQLHRHIHQNIGFTLKRTKPIEEKRNSLK